MWLELTQYTSFGQGTVYYLYFMLISTTVKINDKGRMVIWWGPSLTKDKVEAKRAPVFFDYVEIVSVVIREVIGNPSIDPREEAECK